MVNILRPRQKGPYQQLSILKIKIHDRGALRGGIDMDYCDYPPIEEGFNISGTNNSIFINGIS